MTPAAQRWVGTTSRFPSSWSSRLVLVAIIIALAALAATGGDYDLTEAREWFSLILPWVPMFAILIGPRVAVVTWFLMFAVVLVRGADGFEVAGTMIPTMLLLGVCAFVLVWRAAAIFTLGVVVMLAVAAGVNPVDPVDPVASNGLGLPGLFTYATFVLLAAAAGFGLSLLRTRVERGARREAELREQQARVRAEERTRLAYELHDIVAGQVTLIAMQARRAEFVGEEKTGQILENIGNAAGQTLQDLRSLVLLLKNDDADEDARSDDRLDGEPDLGAEAQDDAADSLANDLHGVVAELEQAGYSVQLAIEGPVDNASASLRRVLSRTVRELGTNILKHADARGVVDLRMAFTAADVTLSASNQISTAAPIISSGTGLEAMRARCEVFGGRLSASADGNRWTTSVTFPSARPPTLEPSESPA